MEKNIQDYIEMHITTVQRMMKENMELSAFITVMGEISNGPDKGKNAIVMIDIPSEDEISKKQFVEEVIPEIGKQIKEEKNITIKCVTFNAESWMRRCDTNDAEKAEKLLKGEWKDLPREEVLFMDISTAEGCSSRIYDIYRDRFSVSESGELISDKILNEDGLLEETVELVLNEELSNMQNVRNDGIFANLYEKFTKL